MPWFMPVLHCSSGPGESRAQTVQLAGEAWSFAVGESLITEYSVKYDPAEFTALAERAGWQPLGRWSDPAEDLSLHLLVTADS